MGGTQPYVRSQPPCCLVDKFHYQVFLGAVANAGAYDAAHILNQRGFVFALFVVPKDQLKDGSSSFRVEVAKVGQMVWGVSPP